MEELIAVALKERIKEIDISSFITDKMVEKYIKDGIKALLNDREVLADTLYAEGIQYEVGQALAKAIKNKFSKIKIEVSM